MSAILEEELDIMTEPLPSSGPKTSTGLCIDSLPKCHKNKINDQRVSVHQIDCQVEPSPFLERSIGVSGKVGNESPDHNSSCTDDRMHLKFLLKQQEMLSAEIRRITKNLLEKTESHLTSEADKSARATSKGFKDDTAQVAVDKALPRHNSEPEAQSIDPRLKQDASPESSEKKSSRSVGRKRRLSEEEDQLSLCRPVQAMDEEVRTNEPIDSQRFQGYSTYGCKRGSNRSSGKSSSGNLNAAYELHPAKRKPMSESCHEMYQGFGPGQAVFGSNASDTAPAFAMTHSKMPGMQYGGGMGPYMAPQMPMEAQMPMAVNHGFNQFIPHQFNYGGRPMMMPCGPGQRMPVPSDQFPAPRGPMYIPQQMGMHMGPFQPNRMPMRAHNIGGPQQQTHSMAFAMKPGRATPMPTGAPVLSPAPRPSIDPKSPPKPEKNSETPIQNTTQNNIQSQNEHNSSGDKAAGNEAGEAAFTDMQDFNLSPEDFDAIFADLDSQDIAV